MMGFARLVVLIIATIGGGMATAQPALRIDSLPPDGLPLRAGWRWHPGDDAAWASPGFDDSRWDTIRPARNILRLPDFQQSPMGWLRLTFTLSPSVSQRPLSVVVNQTGASELYIDGKRWQQLGRVGSTYEQQQGFQPSARDWHVLPLLSAGRHVLAVRLSQHRPPGYIPKLIYFNGSVFDATLFRAGDLSYWIVNQVYTQTLGNYLLVGIFLMLSVIHFLYYYYRRKRVNLVFALTMVFGFGCLLLIESVGLTNNPATAEGLFFSEGLFVAAFMFCLLVTYYVYLEQSIAWQLGVVGILLLVPRLVSGFFEPTAVIRSLSFLAFIALFADGIRTSVAAIRANRANAWFMLNSIVILLLILFIGAGVSWWLVSPYPEYSGYAAAVTNVLFFLTLPISFAIILARDYAQTNRNLEDRLLEVAQLSREKESILTRQNETLEQQVTLRTAELNQSLTELRTTQSQLIQAEKMASLGELTAGIAHEIQNPLNFVNNFAEVSTELMDELMQHRQTADHDEELEHELLTDVQQNLQKINQHGNRASAIIKGMLEHARPSAGKRELTDLNALTEEYLNLAYHGIRAKDKTFEAQLTTDLAPALGLVSVVPQEMGRVLLNLFNNAFYAVKKRQQTETSGYQPAVAIFTSREADRIQLKIRDNGTGIPESEKGKIFQPFFTTKPTGQGTGLGLSISYDIVTKGHGGTLAVESEEDQFTELTITLPISPQNRKGVGEQATR